MRPIAVPGSLSGRIVVLLTIGMSIAAFAALLLAEQAQRYVVDHLRLQGVVASAADMAGRLHRDPAATARALADDSILGARLPPPGARVVAPDPLLTAMLRERLGAAAAASGQTQPPLACFPTRLLNYRNQTAGGIHFPLPDCWLITFRDARGAQRLVSIGLPHFALPMRSAVNPLYIALIVSASALLAAMTARAATAPLRRLARAAEAFSVYTDPEPIPERGPREVRTALATFNLMQRRVTAGLRERTHILAAISHDLQTPLTRLRLRLEQVPDEALRERLIADLAGTQKLVREGLDLARSSESHEPWQAVDMDSLLASLAEDAAEFGADVRYPVACNQTVWTKPDALVRCLTNLTDNAVKYGGSAELRCVRVGAQLDISVRDRGPGLPKDALERMFEPFVRGETSRSRATGGTGIGLTIARAQARLFDGSLTLANHGEGGLIACLRITLRARN